MKVSEISSKRTFLISCFSVVCVNTVRKFAGTLDDSIKKDPKKIETEFKKFCKSQKNKEKSFVSDR